MTTATQPEVRRQGGGMRTWMFLCPWWSDIGGQRFLSRFIVFFTPLGGLHVTRIHMADNARDYPHDHSATFLSFKFGWYSEDVYSDPRNLAERKSVRHRRFGIHRLRHTEAHSIREVSPHLVTVLFLGRRRGKSSYWTPDGKRSTGMRMDDELTA